MKLIEFVSRLQKMIDDGHGDKEVFYRQCSSGDCGRLNYARVTDAIDAETGPFDLPDGAEYISISAGN